MMGDMQDLIVDLPDEIYDLLEEEKIGALQWKTIRGYLPIKVIFMESWRNGTCHHLGGVPQAGGYRGGK